MRGMLLAGIAGVMAFAAAGCGGGAASSRSSADSGAVSGVNYQHFRIKRINIGETYPERAWRSVVAADSAPSPYRRLDGADVWEEPRTVEVARVQPSRSRSKAGPEAVEKPVKAPAEAEDAAAAVDVDAAETVEAPAEAVQEQAQVEDEGQQDEVEEDKAEEDDKPAAPRRRRRR